MTHNGNSYIMQALDLARQLSVLADEGEAASRDDGCIVLYSVIRDCAYHVRTWAERERERHKLLGLWDSAGIITGQDENKDSVHPERVKKAERKSDA